MVIMLELKVLILVLYQELSNQQEAEQVSLFVQVHQELSLFLQQWQRFIQIKLGEFQLRGVDLEGLKWSFYSIDLIQAEGNFGFGLKSSGILAILGMCSRIFQNGSLRKRGFVKYNKLIKWFLESVFQ
ncbi:hypothetical protein ABPG73_018191 [Tetrahymena malaccensis]